MMRETVEGGTGQQVGMGFGVYAAVWVALVRYLFCPEDLSVLGFLIHGNDVLKWGIRLQGVGGCEDVASVRTENLDGSPDGAANIAHSVVGEEVLDIHPTVESELSAVIGLQSCDLHSAGAHLHRIQDRHTHLDQFGDQGGDGVNEAIAGTDVSIGAGKVGVSVGDGAVGWQADSKSITTIRVDIINFFIGILSYNILQKAPPEIIPGAPGYQLKKGAGLFECVGNVGVNSDDQLPG
jgi:hypothetical protein